MNPKNFHPSKSSSKESPHKETTSVCYLPFFFSFLISDKLLSF